MVAYIYMSGDFAIEMDMSEGYGDLLLIAFHVKHNTRAGL